MFGDIGIIQARGPSITTSLDCARNWRKTRRILCISAPSTVPDTSSWRNQRQHCKKIHEFSREIEGLTMGGIRLRTKFLLSMVLVSATLTFTTLLVVRRTVQQEVRLGIQRDLQNSVSAFHNFQKQREVTLERSAALLADLPNVRALMTTRAPATIQDASRDLWKLAGSDLLLLADSSGKVMALQATPPEISAREAQDFSPHMISLQATRDWWYVEGHLYEVFLQDIYFGPANGHQILGYLLLGYEIDDTVTRDLSRVAGSEVAFRYRNSIVRSTLDP